MKSKHNHVHVLKSYINVLCFAKHRLDVFEIKMFLAEEL